MLDQVADFSRQEPTPVVPIPPSSLTPAQHRSALALAEAMLPHAYGIPGADERTVAVTERVVRMMTIDSPWSIKAWGAAQQALDTAAVAYTGHRFADLPAERQEDLFRRWEKHPVLRAPLYLLGFFFKIAHFDLDHVYGALGGKRFSAKVDKPRWMQEQVHEADAWAGDEEIECDVVVVGTGAGGAAVATGLAEHGHAVLLIEEGHYHQRDAFNGSSLDSHERFYRGHPLTLGNVLMPIFQGKMVGGSTALNTCCCFRAPDWIHDGWCERLGTGELTAETFRPYYEAVEAELQVAVADPRFIGPYADVVARGCNKLGWDHGPIPRNAPGCEGEGFCQMGCASDSRRSTNISYVPRALRAGAMLFTDLRADNIRIENGRAIGIDCTAVKNGKRIRVRAQETVFAGGALPTPLFLLAQGICNSSGQVGRNLSLHPSAGMSALHDDVIAPAAHIPQGYVCNEHLRDGIMITAALTSVNFAPVLFGVNGRRFMELMSLRDHIASVGVLMEDSAVNGRVWRDYKGQAVVTYNWSRTEADKMHWGIVKACEMFLAAGARRLLPSVHGFPVIESERELRAFSRQKLSAGDFMMTSFHPLCTCRMGTDPKTSVVDLNHETWDVKDLFLVDGSTMPSAPSVNPQVTIMAMALRAADRIHERLD